MADEDYPLIVVAARDEAERNKLRSDRRKYVLPSAARQGERIPPRLQALQDALEAERLRVQAIAPQENAELVVVFETIGAIANFNKAVARVEGLEWLSELIDDAVEADLDFHLQGERDKPISSKLFLVGTNQAALQQVLQLWNRYQANPDAPFDRGLAPWKQVFSHLRDVRWWGPQDRLGEDILNFWRDEVDIGKQSLRFEIEAWCYRSAQKNLQVAERITALVVGSGGQVLDISLLVEIGYHGFLVEVPAALVAQILAGQLPDLVLSERIMYFRPRGQSVVSPTDSDHHIAAEEVAGNVAGTPVVALFDGLPLQNHAMLAGRVQIDDPDGWEANYEAKDRVHGTSMASLIIHGELDEGLAPLTRPIYVRPILRPDPADFRPRRAESTPNDRLLLDLMHRAVRRLFEGEGDQPPVAPDVRIVNLSLGDQFKVFSREMSPWARLIDWLSFKYKVLFVVSAGNWNDDFTLDTPPNTLAGLTAQRKAELTLAAFLATETTRRLLSPAESINALTVGATHQDQSNFPAAADRHDLFESGFASPLSRIGFGYRRAIKPDLLMPGGRLLYRETPRLAPEPSLVSSLVVANPPGQRVACPPVAGVLHSTQYSRGTSNATALLTRTAARAFEVVAALRTASPDVLPSNCDAVILKALLAHGASWGALSQKLLDARPNLHDWRARRQFVARWIGYGAPEADRALHCAENRVTLIGAGELENEGAMSFSMPLPPGLSAQAVKRRLTVTLAWFSPVNPAHQAYRVARLWISPPTEQLRVQRIECVDDHTKRGTLQHEILDGDQATAFVDGDFLQFKVNCAKDSNEFEDAIPFAICISLEVAVETGISIYDEVRQRIAPPIAVLAP